jgi:hypothetical protein
MLSAAVAQRAAFCGRKGAAALWLKSLLFHFRFPPWWLSLSQTFPSRFSHAKVRLLRRQ